MGGRGAIVHARKKMLNIECTVEKMSTYARRTRSARRPQQDTGFDLCYCPSVDRVVSTAVSDGNDKIRRTQSYWDRQTTVVCWAEAHKECIERSLMARITSEDHPRFAGSMVDGWRRERKKVEE